jgi:hypothetical protein
MKVSALIAKLIEAVALPNSENAREQFVGFALKADLSDEGLLNPDTELSRDDAIAIWGKAGCVRSAFDDGGKSPALVRSEPRRIGSTVAEESEDLGFCIPPDLELAIAGKAQQFAEELCKIYRTHAVDAARQGIADVNASILDALT